MGSLFQVKFREKITTLRKTEAGIPQGSVLGPALYLIHTSDLLTSDNTTTTLATHKDPVISSMKFQATINKINDWAKNWRIKIIQSKSMYIIFILCNQTCRTVQMGNVDLTQKNEVKYLGMHLDIRLIWAERIKTKRKQLNLKAKEMRWLLTRPTLSTESKLLLYKALLKPISTYGIWPWGGILQFQH
jgi:hypothetical protein